MTPGRHGIRRLRRPATVIAAGLPLAGFAVYFPILMLDDGVNDVNAGLDQKVFGAAVFATMAWFAWRVTIYP